MTQRTGIRAANSFSMKTSRVYRFRLCHVETDKPEYREGDLRDV